MTPLRSQQPASQQPVAKAQDRHYDFTCIQYQHACQGQLPLKLPTNAKSQQLPLKNLKQKRRIPTQFPAKSPGFSSTPLDAEPQIQIQSWVVHHPHFPQAIPTSAGNPHSTMSLSNLVSRGILQGQDKVAATADSVEAAKAEAR